MEEDKNLSNIETETEELSADELLPSVPDAQEDLLTDFIKVTDAAEIDSMVPMFNSFFKKRDIIQKHAEYDLKDKLLEQMMERLEKTPHNFNNSDLAVWMKTVQQAIDSSQKNIDQQNQLPTQTVNYQQNNSVHVSIADSLSRESRTRITDAIQKILQNVQNEELSGVCLNESGEQVNESTSPEINNNEPLMEAKNDINENK